MDPLYFHAIIFNSKKRLVAPKKYLIIPPRSLQKKDSYFFQLFKFFAVSSLILFFASTFMIFFMIKTQVLIMTINMQEIHLEDLDIQHQNQYLLIVNTHGHGKI